MGNEAHEKLVLFAKNVQSMKKEFAWHDAFNKRLAALLYAQAGKPVDCEAIRRCHALIKENTGLFSAFRGNMALCLAALLSLADSSEHLIENMIRVYAMLKDVKFRASDYLAVAAFQIAAGCDAADYPRTVERARFFYDGMKAYHWFHTGQDDYIFAAMLGLSDTEPQEGIERIEQLYSRLKSEFWDKNSVQALAQILVLGGSCEDAADRVLALRDALRAQKLRLDKTYTLPLLGVLALLPVDIGVIACDLTEARDFLRAQKGFGSWSVNTQELLLYVAAVVGSHYADGAKDGVITAALSTSIANIIIAQQAAMIAAMSASSSAAAASSASN